MKVYIKEIRKICEKYLISNRLKAKVAKIIVDDYIEGELLGKNTHGLWAFSKGCKNAIKQRNKKIKVLVNRNNYALINGNHQSGQLVADQARALLVKKAQRFGIAMVGVRNAHSFLRPGTQAEYIARKDLIGLIFHNGGGALVPPFGGIDPVISTDPLGYAIPTAGHPLVLDMAISERAWGEVKIAQDIGTKKLPAHSFLDYKGNITTDPYKAYSALPFGGYKGFAIGLLMEVLSGSLVGGGVGLKKNGVDNTHYGTAWRGTLFVAIDPSKFVNLNKFKRENSQLVKELKHSRKRPGVKEILMPGELAYRNKAKCLKRGWFEVDKKIIDKIYQLV